MKYINTTLDSIAGWLGKRVNLLLILLLLQIGMFVGLMRVSFTSAAASVGATRAIAGQVCGPWQIGFSSKAQVGDVRRWMINFNANIVAGPNETGAFEMTVPGQTLDAIRETLGELADSVQGNALCPLGH
jgi:hypothetical protein